MIIEFIDDFGDTVRTQAYLTEQETSCEECYEDNTKVYQFTSDTGMKYEMCRLCIDADDYVRVGRKEPVRY